jgi:hypothetical protein
VSDNIVKLKRRIRPLRKTYQPSAPYVVERNDDEYSIRYEIIDERPESYRIVCFIEDDSGRAAYSKHDAEQIARALNFMVQCGKEDLPKVRETDDFTDQP